MIENTPNTVHFQEYFKVLRTRFWVIFTIFILTVLSGAYVTEEVLPKEYEASAQIQIKPRGTVEVPSLVRPDFDGNFDSTAFQAEFEIMQSSKVYLPIIERLDLEHKWAVQAHLNVDKITQLEALAHLGAMVKVDMKRGTNIVVIAATSEDPKEAAQIANAVANQYKEMRDNDESQRVAQGADSIRADITQQEKVVDDRRATVDRLRDEAAKKGIDIDNRSSGLSTLTDTDLDNRKKDLLAAKEDADARRVLMESVAHLNDDEFVNTMSALNHEESNITTLRSEAFKLQSDIDNLLKQGYGEDNPRVLAARAELATHQQQITDLIAGQRRAIQVDYQMAQSRIELLQSEVDALTEKSQKSAELRPPALPRRRARV